MRYDSDFHACDVIDKRRLSHIGTAEKRYIADMFTNRTGRISDKIYLFILMIRKFGGILGDSKSDLLHKASLKRTHLLLIPLFDMIIANEMKERMCDQESDLTFIRVTVFIGMLISNLGADKDISHIKNAVTVFIELELGRIKLSLELSLKHLKHRI